MNKTPRVLVLSDLFPNPARPAFGIFVERQCHYLQAYCQQVVVAPVRVFPHLRIWGKALKPREFVQKWSEWQGELKATPANREVNGLSVYYPRYTSPPRQGFLGTWGYFAYPFLLPLLRQLHEQHNFDLIHAHYAAPSGTIALLARRWMHVPVVLSVHGYDLAYTIKLNQLNKRIIIDTFEKVDAILANSHQTAQGISNYSIPKSKVHWVPLGANPEISLPFSSSRKDYFEILTVGYLYKQKGHEFVLKAIADLIKKGYRLRYTIVGDGPEATHLHELTHTLGLDDCVFFEGYKPHDQVWSYFSRCDLFVLPSWNEAFGLVYIEALWMGKPVIGCRGEGGPEDLKALGDCVTLVEPRDVYTLRDAMQKLIDSPHLLHQMGETGQKIVREYYTWEKTAHTTFEIYTQVLQKNIGFDSKIHPKLSGENKKP